MTESEIRTLLQTIAIQTRKNYAAQLRKLDLHIGQELALFHLWQQDGITQSQLRHKIGSEASTVSNMLRKLEKDGIVYRKHNELDHRISHVFLTDKGRQLEGPINEIWTAHEQNMLQGFSPDELHTLHGLLSKIEHNLSESKQ